MSQPTAKEGAIAAFNHQLSKWTAIKEWIGLTYWRRVKLPLVTLRYRIRTRLQNKYACVLRYFYPVPFRVKVMPKDYKPSFDAKNYVRKTN